MARFSTLPRRKRLLVITSAAAAVFVAVSGIAVWQVRRPPPIYRPGEAIEGLTTRLARDLPADYPRVRFEDASEQAGIRFRHFAGTRSSQLPEDMGSGAAWGDYDNDGWPDLYVPNLAGPLTMSPQEIQASPARAALYRNNGDGTFTEVAEPAGVALGGWGMGAAWADYDNDGWLDLFVSRYGENALFRNNGDGTFADRTEAAGVGGASGFWSGVAWADFDRDGFVDLYVGGYVRYERLPEGATTRHYDIDEPASLNPSSFAPERNLLYRNTGRGTFVEMAVPAGVSNPTGRSLGVAWCDFDDDGWPDLYVANDVSDNALFHNLGNGLFDDIGLRSFVADYRGAMGLAVGDWDGDADMDLFVTHWIAQENALYTNRREQIANQASTGQARPAMRFMDDADRRGLGQIALDYVGWGTSFFDYDNDGRLDLLVVNGSTLQRQDHDSLLVPMRDQLFWNRGATEGFYDISTVAGEYFQREYVGRGAAFADYDGDGDVDVFIVNHNGPGVLLRNEGGNRQPWLEVRLEGRRSNRAALGARLRLVAGGTAQIREVGAQSSYLSQNSLIQHFGLGNHARVDTLEIRWPSGLRQVLTNLPSNQRIDVVEGETPR